MAVVAAAAVVVEVEVETERAGLVSFDPWRGLWAAPIHLWITGMGRPCSNTPEFFQRTKGFAR